MIDVNARQVLAQRQRDEQLKKSLQEGFGKIRADSMADAIPLLKGISNDLKARPKEQSTSVTVKQEPNNDEITLIAVAVSLLQSMDQTFTRIADTLEKIEKEHQKNG